MNVPSLYNYILFHYPIPETRKEAEACKAGNHYLHKLTK